MATQGATLRSKQELIEKMSKPEVITGSEILLRSLVLEGVECVFGYPGGAVLYIYDAMHGFDDFHHILTRHEQGAIHAADGYARASGNVGVCIATSGPGATNLVTGIATAYMDSVPLVVITGNVVQSAMGTDAFQEADIVGITMPITKHSYLVRNAEDLPRIIHEAFHIANTGRKGPVLIDIPKDVSAAKTLFKPASGEVSMRGYNPTVAPKKQQVDKMLKAIEEAERPLILAGGGVVYSGAHEELLEFATKTGIPVVTTLLGLGGFPSGNDLWVGMPGMHGAYASNKAIQGSDLLINIGARFDDRVTMKLDGFAPNAKIVHIDIDPAEIGKNVPTDIPIVGDVKTVLETANAEAKPAAKAAAWREHLTALKAEFPMTYVDSNTELKPQWVIEMLHETTNGDAIVTTDVGQHQMWAAQYYKFNKPRSFVTSGGLGTMGFGFPSAIGAQMANPDRVVVSINGDGGMQMCAQELAICAINNIPVKVAIINNQVLGMVRQWQEIIYDNRYSHIDLAGSPDFVKLADAYGVKGFRATNKEEAREAWEAALRHPGPAVVEFVVRKGENVYPMVTQGNTIDDMILGDAE
ncbi:acetolactate synthase large subunit [Paenibacillus cellulosilyticus]|uniref:Acetolactate synthase n=1 Tax=Paenibacillus cellulosilyticus TaxID=375489 RepID=A0A2V2YZB4_9BACL|nr:biosynthetic-type acetolactate synthase large subunit [Paenibacillus cellulosilyticus]PWW07470.1 acetolactate synthase large subunit [Paenibacillus cellulosilyticus]QKS44375.1 biosynthetic-type acetolactate synthase large subunit [Paenibacillus cellulosilyticus]